MSPEDTLAKLESFRTRKDLKLKNTKHLKDTFTGFDGQEHPLDIRYYQVQMILHLVAMSRFVVGDDTGLGKCCLLETRIPTDKGLIPLGDLSPSSGVLVPDTFYDPKEPVRVWNGTSLAPVRRFYYSGERPTKKITTRRGFTLEGTLVHPILIRREEGNVFVPLQDIRPGDYVCLNREGGPFVEDEPLLPQVNFAEMAPNARKFDIPSRMSPELARLLGYIVAEAWTNSRFSIRIFQSQAKNPEVHADMGRLISGLFNLNTQGPVVDKEDYTIGSVYLREFFRRLGVGLCLAKDKRIPPILFQSTRESVIAFLQGYFDGEGSVGLGTLEVSSASGLLLREVQQLLLHLGMLSTLSPRQIKGREHTYWRLVLCGDDVRLFQRIVGLREPRKQRAMLLLFEKKANSNLDVIPFSKRIVQGLRFALRDVTGRKGSNDLRKGSGIKQFGLSFEKSLNNIRRGRNPTYPFLHTLLGIADGHGLRGSPETQELQQLVDSHFFYDPVKSVEDGVGEVADLEMDGPQHSFVGNGFVNHNTVEAIAALCYIWEARPEQKAIILTTKSATPQWGNEFLKFTTGVKAFVCQGTPVARTKIREAFEAYSEGPAVLTMGYRTAVQDFRHIQDWSDYILITDECFQYHTPIVLSDGTTELIGRIVSQRMPVEVLSWNPDTRRTEPKRVVDWHRNPLHRARRKSLLSISFRFGGNVRVTRTHNFYTPDGREVPATKLRKGSEVQHLCNNIPSGDQWQIILGALLGDSSISHPNRPRPGVAFGHCAAQGDYLHFKRDMLTSLGVSDIDTTPNAGYPLNGGGEKGYARFRLNGNAAVASFLTSSRLYQDGKKRITADWLDRIGPLGLAVWYADDGSLNEHACLDGTITRRISLHTQGFTRNEIEILAGWFRWKWGINVRVKITKPRSDRPEGQRKSYPYLYLDNKAASQFLDILPCGFPGVMYKFPNKPCANPASFDIVPQCGLVTDWVTLRRVWTPLYPDKDRYVYNLEVEGNHNYIANGTLVSNCTAYKNPKTQVHQVVRHLSNQATRVWALTATLIKNNLLEGYGIFQVVNPNLFVQNGRVMSMTQFMFYFCIVEMISIPRSPRKIPKVVGYTAEKVDEFRQTISPYYLGRPKHKVASELPTLTMKTLEVGMSPQQELKYVEALAGLLTIGESTGEEEEREVTKLTAVTYCQEVVDHLALIDCPGESKKVSALIDLLSEGDLAGEKVIVFTRFKKLVNLLEPELKKAKINAVRITGDENGAQREKNKARFQDPKSGVNVVMITMAGSDAINLQAAKAIVFIDSPWSAGDYLQILGRMIRIGSIHDRVYAVHLVARSKKRATIDHRVMEVLNKKMGLVEAVLGKRLKGTRAKTEVFDAGSDLGDLFDVLVDDAKGDGFSPNFIGGSKKKSKPALPEPEKVTVQKFKVNEDTVDLDDLWD